MRHLRPSAADCCKSLSLSEIGACTFSVLITRICESFEPTRQVGIRCTGLYILCTVQNSDSLYILCTVHILYSLYKKCTGAFWAFSCCTLFVQTPPIFTYVVSEESRYKNQNLWFRALENWIIAQNTGI